MFEELVLITHYNWLAWVDASDVVHKYPVSLTFHRLHYRALEATQTSSLTQEKATIRFRQQIVNMDIIRLGLKIAKANQCL